MAITLVGINTTATVTNGGTVTLNMPTGVAENDVVVIFAGGSNSPGSTPSTWTEIEINEDVNTVLAYKVMGASPDSNVSFWDTGGTSDSGAALAMAFRGVDTANVLDVAVVSGTTGSSDPPAIVPTSNDTCICVFGTDYRADPGDSSPGSITNYLPSPTTVASANDNADTVVAGAYRILSGGAGASENPGNWSTWSITGDAYAVTIALRPLVATGQPYAKRVGGVKFVGNRAGQNTNLWRKAGELFLPQPSIIRV